MSMTAMGPAPTAIGGGAGFRAIPDGQYTATIYGYIRDGKFDDAIRVLSHELEVRTGPTRPASRQETWARAVGRIKP